MNARRERKTRLRDVQLNKSFLIRSFKPIINHLTKCFHFEIIIRSQFYARIISAPSLCAGHVIGSNVIASCQTRKWVNEKRRKGESDVVAPVRKSRRVITAPCAYFKFEQSSINQMVDHTNCDRLPFRFQWKSDAEHFLFSFCAINLSFHLLCDGSRGGEAGIVSSHFPTFHCLTF